MKLSCLQEHLLKGLKTVIRATARHSTLPVLANVLLDAQDGKPKHKLRLSTTNLELGITSWVSAKVEKSGSVTIPARTLTDWVKSLPKERIDLELVERTQTLKLRCGRQRANIKGIDAQEFPTVPIISEGFELPAEQLCDMVARTYISAAKDESRPVLAGILMSLDDGLLTLAAADGFRLSVCEAEVSTKAEGRTIVPANSLNELTKVADGDYIQVELRDNQVLFRSGDTCLVSQLINGLFPDYGQIIPKGHTTRAIVEAGTFKRACTTAEIFAREATYLVKLTIRESSIAISSTSTEYGNSMAEINAEVEGEEMTIGMNVAYLLDLLGVIDGQLEIGLTTSSSPILFRPVDSAGFTHVIMPMQVRTE